MVLTMEGKSGLVTASGSGIGRASAVAMAKAGAKVMVSDVNEEAGKETVKIITDNGGEAQFRKCDVSDEEQVKELVDATVSEFGKLDVGNNNAGVNEGGVKSGAVE